MILSNKVVVEKITKIALPTRIEHLSEIIQTKFSEKFYWKPNAHEPVNNCEDAIRVRGIKPHQELKSIMLKLRGGFLLFHLRGNERIDPKKVNKIHRDIFGNKTKIRLATDKELSTFNSIKGTVNPLLISLWNLHHVISPTVFQESFVWTNDGELNGYVKFSPKLLLEAQNNSVLDFIQFRDE
ncbi:MAG: YbaK/EbsC family protein [Bacteroidia bacterium]|nr:YbaK/EbsC family protein [Bacteroidia bacterium]